MKTTPENILKVKDILKEKGLDVTLWHLDNMSGCDRELRLFAVWCARQVQHLMQDERSIKAIDVAEKYANGLATERELNAAADAAYDASLSANDAADAANAAACYAVDAADDVAGVGWSVARTTQETEFKRLLDCLETSERYEISGGGSLEIL